MSEHFTHFNPDPADSRPLRDALGRFATGVCVITALDEAGPIGMTANSFASLSLDPPLVMWSPARASRRFTSFVEANHFAIHVLAADQVELAHHFARNARDFDRPGVAHNAQSVPTLNGVLARFDCAREAVHDAGDHAIVVGRVLAVCQRAAAPLVFAQGRMGPLGLFAQQQAGYGAA